MRRLIIIPIVLLLISCGMGSPKTTVITILADRTDPIIPKPSLEDIYPLLDLETYPSMGIEINFQNIGNVDYSPIYQEHLKASSLLDNTLQRDTNIKRFYTTVDSMITNENVKEYTYSSSSIVVPLVAQLQALSTSKSTDRNIVLYSDLAEFSDVYNVYDYSSNVRLQKEPIKVAEHFKSKLDIPDLRDIKLYICFYPTTPVQNRLFQNMMGVYREVFRESGLQIQFGLQQPLNQK